MWIVVYIISMRYSVTHVDCIIYLRYSVTHVDFYIISMRYSVTHVDCGLYYFYEVQCNTCGLWIILFLCGTV